MKEVAFDLTKKYPPVEPPVTAEGEVASPTVGWGYIGAGARTGG